MKANAKIRLGILSLFASSALALAAEPVLLDAPDMDRVTAGSQSFFANLLDMLKITPPGTTSLLASGWLPLTSDQLSSIKKALANELAVLQQSAKSGAVTTYQVRPGETITTYQLRPGESLQIQQFNSGGSNYAFVRSNGASSVQIYSMTRP
ncbi:hypothetical protein [Noviherbaspirillum massiliense]|uniref:hypothetical protein n=1 Tax=Noviherbaspirillum massiliense TaxID=1465823 RepID=UPI0002FE4447|nr:hypothetical protein [Noviherbaspirillum massiliense]